MLEPGVSKYAVYSPEDVCQLPHALNRASSFATQRQPRREMLGTCQHIGRPVERVIAVINRAAGFGGLMHSTEILPLARSHFLACQGRAGWIIVHQEDGDDVGLLCQESAKFVEPQISVHGFGFVDLRRSGQRDSRLSRYRNGVRRSWIMCKV